MSKALRYWTAAALFTVGLIAMHLFSGAWVPALVPELNRSITDPTPLSLGAKGFMMTSLVLSVAAPVGVVLCACAALSERDRRRWAVREQVFEMAQQIRAESMSEEWREWHRQGRRQQVEIQQEARRRLGLPEEDPDENRVL
jgi:hypothetical protein